MVSTADFITNKKSNATNEEYVQFLCEMCSECIVDEVGNELFEGKKADFLREKHFGVVQRIGVAILKMHGMTEESAEEKKTD